MPNKILDVVSVILRQPVLFVLFLYTNYITLLFTPRCRFYPSCSRYTYDAVRSHGIFRGFKLALVRILKCHPWHEGGIDPVPETQKLCCEHPAHQPKETLL
jgi:putative membrane protein insertion efficiency factor